EGQIKASEKLAEATGKLDEAAPRRLVAFEPHKVREFAVHEKLTLKPGPQKFRVWARTAAGDENETAIILDYRPRLPQLVLRLPRPETILYEGRDPQEVTLEGVLELPADRSEFAAAILVNGAVSDSQPILDRARQRLTARVRLQLGDNRIQVRLSNAW